ncbi:MAG: Hpt domain-containing protein, partial [Desulfomonile sp.]
RRIDSIEIFGQRTMMITIDKLVEELGMEPDEVAEFISVFLDYTENEDLPALLEGVNSRNPEIVRQRAHSIKGAALNLMLTEISSLAEQMEKNAASGNLDQSEARYNAIVEKVKMVRDLLT